MKLPIIIFGVSQVLEAGLLGLLLFFVITRKKQKKNAAKKQSDPSHKENKS